MRLRIVTRLAQNTELGIVAGNPGVSPSQPVPQPAKTTTRLHGLGFWRVGVGVLAGWGRGFGGFGGFTNPEGLI